MTKYYVVYLADYGLTVKYIGEFPARIYAQQSIIDVLALHILDEFELRAFSESIKNQLN